MKSISVVIPIYNEAEYINSTINAFIKTLPEITSNFEIIAVDDASTDNSAYLLNLLAKNNSCLKILKNNKNKKLGETLRKGFNAASKNLILYADCDLPFNIKQIKTALNLMIKNKSKIITAFRTNRNADGILRSVYSYTYNVLINYLFGLNIIDINFPLKLFERKILQDFPLESEGSFISAEFLIKSKLNNYKITQFPVTFFPRTKGTSTLATPPVIIKILKELIFFYPKLKNLKHNII